MGQLDGRQLHDGAGFLAGADGDPHAPPLRVLRSVRDEGEDRRGQTGVQRGCAGLLAQCEGREECWRPGVMYTITRFLRFRRSDQPYFAPAKDHSSWSGANTEPSSSLRSNHTAPALSSTRAKSWWVGGAFRSSNALRAILPQATLRPWTKPWFVCIITSPPSRTPATTGLAHPSRPVLDRSESGPFIGEDRAHIGPLGTIRPAALPGHRTGHRDAHVHSDPPGPASVDTQDRSGRPSSRHGRVERRA